MTYGTESWSKLNQIDKMIDSFHGKYRFLSNFWKVPIEYEGTIYPTLEHAYQASKSYSIGYRTRILSAATPGEAKRLGRVVELRPDWELLKEGFMLVFLRQKFHFPELREKLLATGEEELIEGNGWHDEFWGVCDGSCRYGPHSPNGLNKLGKLLMKVRDEIKTNPTKN